MWDAFNNVLEKGGVVAALFFVVIIAAGIAIRALWKANSDDKKEFQKKIDELTASHAKQIADLTKAHKESIALLSDKHAESNNAMSDEIGAQIAAVVKKNEELQSKLDGLQERRVSETRDNTERVMSYIKHMDGFVMKLEAAIDVLLKASRGGGR